MPLQHDITPLYWTIIERQAHARGQVLSSFGQDVAESVLQAGLLAFKDRSTGMALHRVVSAPTGSGKSSYAMALVAALIGSIPHSSALVLCETIDQCEDTFLELAKLVNADELAIWTSAHDMAKPADVIERRIGFCPAVRFFAGDLARYRVVIVAHAFFKGARGHLCTFYEGHQRTLTVVDERPKEVSIFDIDQGDVGKARDWAVNRFGDDSPADDAMRELDGYVRSIWDTENTGDRNYSPLRKSDLSWFSSGEASRTMLEEPDSVHGQVIGFASCLGTGYAFMSRFEGSRRGGRFVGYRPDLPILPGTVLLDATADIDGVTQLAPWRVAVPVPRVSFENLTVTHLAPPEEVVARGERISQIVKKAERAEPYAEWIMETICAHTSVGEEVLAVVHKGLLNHRYLPDRDELGDGAHEIDGRNVAFINWGRGIGSNRWKAATSVFLFGEFHMPRRAITAEALGILREAAATSRLDKLQSPNCQDEVFLALRDGHLLRWEKQLAMRGNARNITPDGVCGHQKLFVTSEFQRFMRYRETLFPRANFVFDLSAERRIKERGGRAALAALLLTWSGDRITSLEVEQETGVILRKHAARLLNDPLVQQAMTERGWRYVSGGGRGNPSRFEAVAASDACKGSPAELPMAA